MTAPFWVPLLTHYTSSGGLDRSRMTAHLASLRPALQCVLLAGSTGDGWTICDATIEDLAAFASEDACEGVEFMIGALRPSTEAVIETCARIESACAARPALDRRLKAIVVCPPVEPQATQNDILRHYRAVLSSSRRELAVYELPQVTGCRISPETFRMIATDPRVTHFKDSSGTDDIARSVAGTWRGVLLRGAEGGYANALRPWGPYDGFLLSTGNVFAGRYRDLLSRIATGDRKAALALSDLLSKAAEVALAAAAQWPDHGNAFALANRAMDHVVAHGQSWRGAPLPRLSDGRELPQQIVVQVEHAVHDVLALGRTGYLSAPR